MILFLKCFGTAVLEFQFDFGHVNCCFWYKHDVTQDNFSVEDWKQNSTYRESGGWWLWLWLVRLDLCLLHLVSLRHARGIAISLWALIGKQMEKGSRISARNWHGLASVQWSCKLLHKHWTVEQSMLFLKLVSLLAYYIFDRHLTWVTAWKPANSWSIHWEEVQRWLKYFFHFWRKCT